MMASGAASGKNEGDISGDNGKEVDDAPEAQEIRRIACGCTRCESQYSSVKRPVKASSSVQKVLPKRYVQLID